MLDVATILLPLNGASTDAAALSLGLVLARRFPAHLQTLHIGVDGREVAPLAGEGLSGAMVEEMMTAAAREAGRRLADARDLFDRAVAEENRNGTPILLLDHAPAVPPGGNRQASVGFRTSIGRTHDLVAHAARLADLIVVPHPVAADTVSSSEALHAVLFDSGRPVLIASRRIGPTIGRRICIAWNGTAEGASAVLSVLGWLGGAEAVQVLHSEEYQRRGPAAAELLHYLSAHGVQAEVATFRSVGGEVGAGLLAAAANFGADLLAMGAYSHSRLRQLILGGVTRHVLAHAELPVLMAR